MNISEQESLEDKVVEKAVEESSTGSTDEKQSQETEPSSSAPQEESIDTTSQESAEESVAASEPAEAAANLDKSLEADEPEAGEGEASKQSPEHVSSYYAAFQEHYDAATTPENKLTLTLEFMQSCLSQEGTPHFRDFWNARRLCVPLFKESIPAAVRSDLWDRYTNLSREARALKDVLDEQSRFAMEQIEMAIAALEQELDAGWAVATTEAPDLPKQIQRHADDYLQVYHELRFLNACATRVNSFRKELVNTDMRIRFKNKLFQRLSKLGERIFPRRKELVKVVSDLFVKDVKAFTQHHFSGDRIRGTSFELRDEIKSLQNFAKELTLSSSAFSQTRKELSGCWDQLREADKERKKARMEKKACFKENEAKVLEKIKEFEESYTDEMELAEASKQLGEIAKFMRDVDLGRDEVKALKEELQKVSAPVDARHEAITAERKRQEQERIAVAAALREELQAKVDALLNVGDDTDPAQLKDDREALITEIRQAQLSKSDKQVLERQLKGVKDRILELQQAVLLNLSAGDREALENLEALYEQQKARRKEVKDLVEEYRKALGGSGLDIGKSMEYNELMAVEKGNLEKIDASLREIETRLKEIKG